MTDPVQFGTLFVAIIGGCAGLWSAFNNRRAQADEHVLGRAQLKLDERKTVDQEVKDLWTELRDLRAELADERTARKDIERECNNERAWSMFLEDFLREHDMPIPPRPIRVRPDAT